VNKKLLTYLGIGALVGLAVYEWRKSKSSGLGGTRMEFDTDGMVDKVSPWVSVNPMLRPLLSGVAKEALRASTGGKIRL